MQAGATTDGAVREWRPAVPARPGRGPRPAAPRPGRPDLARDGRVGGLAGRDHAGRPGDDAAGPPRRRHGRQHAWGPGAAVVARRPARPARRRATDPRSSSPTTRWWPTRTGGCRACGSAPPGGCGTCWCPRCWSRRSPARRRAGRGASCAGASAIPRPARRPRACGSRRRRRRSGPCPTGSGTAPASTPRAAGRSWPARRSRTGWRTRATLGGEAGPGAAAPGPRDRGLDRGRGRPAGLGRPGRGQRRRLPHPGRWSAGRCSAARSTTRRCCRCSRPYTPQRATGGAVRGGVGLPQAALRPAVLPARLPRDVRRVSAATSQTSSLPRRHDRPCEVRTWPLRGGPPVTLAGADVGSAA